MTEKDKFYHLLNDLDGKAETEESTELSQSEKDRLFQTITAQMKPEKKSKQPLKPLFLVAAVLLFLFVGSQTQIGQNVQATARSIIENIRYSLNEALGNEETVIEDSTISFNQVASIGEVDIRIEEMVAFDHRLVFNVLIDLDGPIEEEVFIGFSDYAIEVNGNPVTTQGLIGHGEVYDEEENIHSIVYTADLTQESFLEDEMTIEVSFEDIHLYDPSQITETTEPQPPIEGEVTFTIETSLAQLADNTSVYPIGYSINAEDYDYHIEAFYTHPILNFIEVTSENWGDGTYQLLEIRGEDEQGRNAVFKPNHSLNTQGYRRNSFTLDEAASEITASDLVNVERLELQFYSAGWPEGEEAVYEAYGEPFTVELEEY